MDFKQVYAKLNQAQKEAVDRIYGPVFVLAGPGTGKTQLLSARVANILNLTDAGPENILCLTYTDAGVLAMRSRLASIIGSDAYKVNIHTFHSFALEVASSFSDYFLDTRGFEPIDELTSYLYIEELLDKLPHANKLRHRSFSKEGRINDVTSKIGDLKNAGLGPEDALSLAKKSATELTELQPILDAFPPRMPSKNGLNELIETLALTIAKFKPEDENSAIPSLKNVILESLTAALTAADAEQKTKPLTAWKDANLEKNSIGDFVFKDARYLKNLLNLSELYLLYQQKLEQEEKLEFADMILNLNKALTKNPALKLNLQEKYQFILVDEFQDTNLSQLGIIKSLTEDVEQPNIMAVGDDDQAIYAFQGAKVSNIASFLGMYQNPKLITLVDNYRSGQSILEASKINANQIIDRPAGTTLKALNKKSPHQQKDAVTVSTYQSEDAEINGVTESIAAQVKSGTKPGDIAVLATRHRHLVALAENLVSRGVPVFYDKSNNLLDEPIIQELLNLSKLILALAEGDFNASRHLVASVISAPYWQFPVDAIWKLSLEAHRAKKHWLELISEGFLGEQGTNFYKFITSLAGQSLNLSLEQMLDLMVGVSEEGGSPTPNPSPEREGDILVLGSANESKWLDLKELSKLNREKPTDTERLLWDRIRSKQLGHRFRRQHVVDGYITDFACLNPKLVIEVDGDYHQEKNQSENDQYRTEMLNAYGYEVIRFTNNQVKQDIESVITAIKNKLNLITSSGAPLPFRGGVGGGALLAHQSTSSIENGNSNSTPPLKNYYFSPERLNNNPGDYANFLASLSSLRQHLRAFWPDRSKPKLKDLIIYTDLCAAHGGVKLKTSGMHIAEGGVNILTAYGSKGLEFENIYIIHANDDIWGSKARDKTDTLKFSSNLLSHRDSEDDKTRLFYVAMTRAMHSLNISNFKFDAKGKQKLPAQYLLNLINNEQQVENFKFSDYSEAHLTAEQASNAYEQQLFGANLSGNDELSVKLSAILAPILDGFKLSATSFNNWLKDESEGKIDFITNTLLRFPSARNESAVKGSAVHKALEIAQLKFNKGQTPELQDLLLSFKKEVLESELDADLKNKILASTDPTLTKLWPELLNLIRLGAQPEVSVSANFEEVRLSGKLDSLIFDHQNLSAAVVDYKTGNPGARMKDDYKNQLYFYRLLLEMRPDKLKFNSKQYKLSTGKLIYISPVEDGLVTQNIDYNLPKNEAEYIKFKETILEVWHQIQKLGPISLVY
jgi:superfamily I DNA/RNA helicase